jgi:LEA14-like dessication related protein
LAEQGNIEGFFNNVKNADKLGGLVENIRDAVMDYQVRNQNDFVTPVPDIRFRLRYSEISMTRVVNSS